jgi:hypothetical protein
MAMARSYRETSRGFKEDSTPSSRKAKRLDGDQRYKSRMVGRQKVMGFLSADYSTTALAVTMAAAIASL